MPNAKFQFSITMILLLTCIVAILVAIPRFTAGAELHPNTILWIVTLHQIAIALTVATILWILLGRRLSVGLILALLVVILWGPNLGSTVEFAITGKRTKSQAIANSMGVTPYLNRFYVATYTWLGYNYKATQP